MDRVIGITHMFVSVNVCCVDFGDAMDRVIGYSTSYNLCCFVCLCVF